MSRRLTRLNEQIKREVAEIVRWEIADPRVGPVTVTGADVASDLTTARVFVSLLGTTEEREESLAGLEAAAPFVRSQLAQRLDLRRTPSLRFFSDESAARATRIEKLLSQVEPAEGWDARAEGDATEPGGGEEAARDAGSGEGQGESAESDADPPFGT